MIYHLVTRHDWEARRGGEEVSTPGKEGFVHCCDEHQLSHVRKQWFPPDIQVVALRLDPTALVAETRYETGSRGESERFAHVYGSIRADDVVEVLDL